MHFYFSLWGVPLALLSGQFTVHGAESGYVAAVLVTQRADPRTLLVLHDEQVNILESYCGNGRSLFLRRR